MGRILFFSCVALLVFGLIYLYQKRTLPQYPEGTVKIYRYRKYRKFIVDQRGVISVIYRRKGSKGHDMDEFQYIYENTDGVADQVEKYIRASAEANVAFDEYLQKMSVLRKIDK